MPFCDTLLLLLESCVSSCLQLEGLHQLVQCLPRLLQEACTTTAVVEL